MMKKFLAILLVLAMIFALTACGKKEAAPAAASGEMWPTQGPRVAPEYRPSVIRTVDARRLGSLMMASVVINISGIPDPRGPSGGRPSADPCQERCPLHRGSGAPGLPAAVPAAHPAP